MELSVAINFPKHRRKMEANLAALMDQSSKGSYQCLKLRGCMVA